jgi:diaminopimelate decarboxylase
MKFDRTGVGKSLVEAFGSPLYVYEQEHVDQRLEELVAFLPLGAHLYYSLKANPFPLLVGHLKRRGCRMEVSSVREMDLALQDGFPPENILYSGPGKTDYEINLALKNGISHFSCESFSEWDRLSKASREIKVRCKVLFRINPNAMRVQGLAMSGISSQFGIDEVGFLEMAASSIRETPYCKPCGIHVYYGTQVREFEVLTHSLREISELAARIGEGSVFPMEIVDFGGGFPWPYAEAGDAPLIGKMPDGTFDALKSDDGPNPEMWFEAGRYLVASSGTLHATVIDVKVSKGKHYVVLDAGINNLGGMAGLGRLHQPNLSMEKVGESRTDSQITATVVGPLCSPLDLLGRELKLSDPSPGDVYLIPNVGAYGLTASLVAFLGRTPPTEILVGTDGKYDALRMEITYSSVQKG